jgi:DNA-binding IclR family transcriptional regulator
MTHKYEVPSLRRAHDILQLIATSPRRLKLIELANRLEIHKSSMFSLLKTMEEFNWIARENQDTYVLGSAMGWLGNVFFQQYDLIAIFHREAIHTMNKLQESIQLAKLEGNQVFYLAKVESPSPVKLVSEPGMKFPAYATALGKALISEHSQELLLELYPDEKLLPLTANTITSRHHFFEQLSRTNQQGYAEDLQEATMGFQCIGVPIRNQTGQISAAVSCSMPVHQWAQKREFVIQEVQQLASRLSMVMRTN